MSSHLGLKGSVTLGLGVALVHAGDRVLQQRMQWRPLRHGVRSAAMCEPMCCTDATRTTWASCVASNCASLCF
jgi:hypothetical protein